jgi:hypothetical protein
MLIVELRQIRPLLTAVFSERFGHCQVAAVLDVPERTAKLPGKPRNFTGSVQQRNGLGARLPSFGKRLPEIIIDSSDAIQLVVEALLLLPVFERECDRFGDHVLAYGFQ